MQTARLVVTVRPQRDPKAYRLRLEAAKRQSIERAREVQRCYVEHSPPQVRFGLEMVRTCHQNTVPVLPLYRGRR